MAKSILIFGATGRQGGTVANELIGRGFELHALTRKPESPAARALTARGIHAIKGDMDDADSLKPALAGKWGVFAMQNTWEAGVEREETQGKRVATLAKEAGVSHFVYTSVGSADRNTGIPHFENKYRIEGVVRRLGFPSHVIIRPVFFMENLLTPGFLHGSKLTAAMNPETVLQMIAVRDIGRYGALAFTDAERLNRREIDIAGDAVTMPQAALILSEGLERPIEFEAISIEDVRKQSSDFAAMLEWFDQVGYDADIEGLGREFGIRPLKLDEWAREHRGAEQPA
ncbi:MAG: NmrA/HSCARG family protein [Gemmatimonadales bacterium]